MTLASAPGDPLAVAAQWLSEARVGSTRRNPDAMALATATPTGRPSLRMVLLKEFSAAEGYLVFYTNYGSRKGLELERNPRAAGLLYWEEFGGRQLRLEGPIVRSPAEESDRYFATRAAGSQINAWISDQSKPIAKYEQLLERQRRKTSTMAGAGSDRAADLSLNLRRPEFWGGYRLWIDHMELWIEGVDRLHQRFDYSRELRARDEFSYTAGAWHLQLLQP
jgi:pyridoxamine 5'-phosphate oxidase